MITASVLTPPIMRKRLKNKNSKKRRETKLEKEENKLLQLITCNNNKILQE